MTTPEFNVAEILWRRRHGGDDNGGGDDDGHDNSGHDGGGEQEPNDPDHRGRSTTVNNIGTPTARPTATATVGTRSSSPERSNSPERSASPERASRSATGGTFTVAPTGNTAATPTATAVRGTSIARSTSLGRSASPERTSSASGRSASPERNSFSGVSTGIPATATSTFGAIRSAEPLNLSSSQNKLSGGSIGGIVVGVLGVLGLAIGALLFLRRRNRARNRRALQASLAFRELGEKLPSQGTNYTQGTGRGEFDNNPETMGIGNTSQSRSHERGFSVNRPAQAAENPFRD